MISVMSSTNAESIIEIGRAHRIGWRFLADSPIIGIIELSTLLEFLE